MLIDDVKKQVLQAMRDKDAERRDLLKVVLGELQTAASRTGEAMDDTQAQRIIRKMVKSDQEMIQFGSDRPGVVEKMKSEIEVLESLLPKTLDMGQVIQALAPVTDAIKAAGNDGQATGIAMKHLKSTAANAQGNDVAQAVKQIRA